MGLLVWILFGALAGWLASMLVGNEESQGVLGNIIFGIFGAFVGGFLANLIGGAGITGFNLYSIVVAVLGAALVIFVKEKATH